MKLKSFVAGALLAAASVSAFADNQTLVVNADGNSHNWSSVGSALFNGQDVITFDIATPGVYDIAISLTGQKLKFDPLTSLNGTFVDLEESSSGKLKFLGVEITEHSPWILNLLGTPQTGASYTGTYTVTAVPEPETYGMLLGGLALVGVVARRKAKQAA